MAHEHTHAGGCHCCCLSRRHFLAASTTAAAFLQGAQVKLKKPPTGDLTEHIPIASFRPKPKTTIVSAIVRHKPPYWLGWPGTSYDLEKHRAFYEKTIAGFGKELGVDVVQEKNALENANAVRAFAKKVMAEKPNAVLLTLQHLGVWNWAGTIANAGIPTIIFAPIGTAFTGHVKDISRRPGVHVISSLETDAVKQAMRMIRAKRQLEESRLLVVAGNKRSETVVERLGTKVRYIPRNTLHELFARMPITDEIRKVAQKMEQTAAKVVEPTKQDFLNAARSYATAKRLMRDEKSNAITTDCLGMVSTKVVPTPPCMAASLFQDAGVTYGCEADLNAAFSLMLVSYLFDRPGFQNDPVPETVKNLLIAAHCTCGTRLNGFDKPPEPFYSRSHSESNLGVATQVLWRKDQPVTLIDFQGPNKLFLDTGTLVGNVNTPPAGGCRTSIEIAMDRMDDARDVLGFHQAVFYGNHRRDVEAFCQMYGIEVINSPEKAAKGV